MSKRFVRRERPSPPASALQKPPAMQPEAPESNPAKENRNLMWMILPALLVVGVIGMIVVMIKLRGPGIGTFMFPGLAVFGMVGMAMYSGTRMGRPGNQPRWGERDKSRRKYMDGLDQVRDVNQAVAASQFELNHWANAAPRRLIELVGSERMWERRPKDEDFLDVRLGTGIVGVDQGALKWEDINIPHSTDELEPVTGNALRKFMLVQTKIDGMGKSYNLRAQPGFGIVGEPEATTALVRSMLLSLATYQAPNDVKIVIVTRRPAVWDWVKWLPHNRHDTMVDACGPRRLFFESPQELEATCRADLAHNVRGSWEQPVSQSDNDDSPSMERALLSTGDGGGSVAASRLQHWVVVDDSTGTDAEWAGVTGDLGLQGVTFLRIAESKGSGIGFADPAQIFEVRD